MVSSCAAHLVVDARVPEPLGESRAGLQLCEQLQGRPREEVRELDGRRVPHHLRRLQRVRHGQERRRHQQWHVCADRGHQVCEQHVQDLLLGGRAVSSAGSRHGRGPWPRLQRHAAAIRDAGHVHATHGL
jgi:hypothetical protein